MAARSQRLPRRRVETPPNPLALCRKSQDRGFQPGHSNHGPPQAIHRFDSGLASRYDRRLDIPARLPSLRDHESAHHVPALRPCEGRDDVGRRVPTLLRMRRMWSAPTAARRRLLRLLFPRRPSVPTEAGGLASSLHDEPEKPHEKGDHRPRRRHQRAEGREASPGKRPLVLLAEDGQRLGSEGQPGRL